MQNYKDLNNKVHILDDVGFEHLLPAGCVRITQEEADSLAVKPTKAQQKKAELATLSSTYSSDMRSLRDSWLSSLIANDEDTKAQIALDMEDARLQYLADKAEVIAKHSNQ